MAGAESGGGAGINFGALRERSRQDLCACIDMLSGPKALVLDPSLSGPLGLVAEKQLLKAHGVEKTYHLKSEPLDTDQRRVIFIVRDSIVNVKAIAAQVKYNQGRREKLEYLVCLVPRRTIICERVLEEEGVYSSVLLADYQLGLIALEEDVLSMEIPDALRMSTAQGDCSSLVDTARALSRLEGMYGRIPVIKGKGHHAQTVANMLLRMRLESPTKDAGAPSSAVGVVAGGGGEDAAGGAGSGVGGEGVAIDEIVLLDRCSDLVTPMLSQLTYQGLIDDIYGINNGVVELPAHLLMPAGGAPGPAAKGNKVKVYLNASDALFSQLRDANFEQVGGLVKKRATLLKTLQDEKNELQHKSVGEIKDYVRRLRELNIQQEKNLLSLHTSIALDIKQRVSDGDFSRRLELEQALLQGAVAADKAVDFVQHLMYKGAPVLQVLRLLSLTSMVTDGIKRLDALKAELIQVYGFEMVVFLDALEAQGFLKRADGGGGGGLGSLMRGESMSLSSASVSVAKLTNKLTQATGWEAVKKRMRVLVETDDAGRLERLAESYSGYVPISLRQAQHALFPPIPGGWMSLEETLSILPGPLFEDTSGTPHAKRGMTRPPPDAAAARKTRHVALIFFVGGVTAGEVSLVRALARETAHDPDGVSRLCIIGTSKLLSGDQLLASFYDPFPNALRRDKGPITSMHAATLR